MEYFGRPMQGAQTDRSHSTTSLSVHVPGQVSVPQNTQNSQSSQTTDLLGCKISKMLSSPVTTSSKVVVNVSKVPEEVSPRKTHFLRPFLYTYGETDYRLVVSLLLPYTGDPSLWYRPPFSISPPTSHFILHNKASRHGPNLKFKVFEWYQRQKKRLFSSICQVLLVSSGKVQKEWCDSEFNDDRNYSYKLRWTSFTLWFYQT